MAEPIKERVLFGVAGSLLAAGFEVSGQFLIALIKSDQTVTLYNEAIVAVKIALGKAEPLNLFSQTSIFY